MKRLLLFLGVPMEVEIINKDLSTYKKRVIIKKIKFLGYSCYVGEAYKINGNNAVRYLKGDFKI